MESLEKQLHNIIYGFQGTTLIDFPQEIASIIFLGGCNFRCPYCYNVDLVLPQRLCQLIPLPLNRIIDTLIQRKGFISGVVITGGEPTIHRKKLIKLIEFIKNKICLKVKLDTNGSNPSILKQCIEYVDFIAIDIKTSPNNYWIVKGKWESVEKSLDIIKNSGINHEVRITIAPGVVNLNDVDNICKSLIGVKKIVLQKFINNVETLDPMYKQINPYDREEFEQIVEAFSNCLNPYNCKIETR